MSKQEKTNNDDDINNCINEIFDEQEDIQQDQNEQNNTNQENSFSQSYANDDDDDNNLNSNQINDEYEDDESVKKDYQSNENNLSDVNNEEMEKIKINEMYQNNSKQNQNNQKRKKNARSESYKKDNKMLQKINKQVHISNFKFLLRRYSKSKSRTRSRSYSRHKEDKYYENCCSRCKKNDKGGKTCICIVPKNSRKSNLSQSGCQTCGCKGCSREDHENIRKKTSEQYSSFQKNYRDFQIKNGCCKMCLKAFSQTGRACICQVPEKVRKSQLPKSGCKFCGCQGCNPEDTKKNSYEIQNKRSHNTISGNSNNNREKDRNRRRSNSIDDRNDFNNFDKSNIGIIISNELKMYAPMIGFGVPQRTYSYIIGKPLEKKQ